MHTDTTVGPATDAHPVRDAIGEWVSFGPRSQR